MTRSDDPTPRSVGTLSLEERLERIEAALHDLKTSIDGLPTRVRALEFVVYGGCGVALVAILTALVALVVKH
jgi:hypothetical protein